MLSRTRYTRRYSFGIFRVAYVFFYFRLLLNFSAGGHLFAHVGIGDLLAVRLQPVCLRHRAGKDVLAVYARGHFDAFSADRLEMLAGALQ